MKRITITGNLGKDAECREGQGGHKFVSFSVAYAERDTDAKDEQGNPIKEAQWAECEIYVKPENSAEGIVNLLKKGRFIYVEAYDKVEAWLDKETAIAPSMFSKSIYFGEKFAIFAPMRKELGKWFMDIAKYLLTAVVVGALISDIENSRWLVYVGGIGATLSCLFIGLGLLRQKETNKTQEE